MMTEDKVHALKLWEEIVGTLSGYRVGDDGTGFEIIINDQTFEFMYFDPGYINLLDEIGDIPKGTRIGILRSDNEFRVRRIEK